MREIERSSAAIVATLALVRTLDEHGLLRLANDLVAEEDRVLRVLTDHVPAAEVRRAVENVKVVVAAFRDLDPETLALLSAAIPRGLREARRAEHDRPVGWWDLAAQLRDPEVNRGLRMMLGFLRGVGRGSEGRR